MNHTFHNIVTAKFVMLTPSPFAKGGTMYIMIKTI